MHPLPPLQRWRLYHIRKAEHQRQSLINTLQHDQKLTIPPIAAKAPTRMAGLLDPGSFGASLRLGKVMIGFDCTEEWCEVVPGAPIKISGDEAFKYAIGSCCGATTPQACVNQIFHILTKSRLRFPIERWRPKLGIRKPMRMEVRSSDASPVWMCISDVLW